MFSTFFLNCFYCLLLFQYLYTISIYYIFILLIFIFFFYFFFFHLFFSFFVFFIYLLSFLCIYIITHHLNEVDFGIINLYNSFIVFLSSFIAIGVQYAIGVDYFKLEEKPFRQHFTNSMVIPIIACI